MENKKNLQINTALCDVRKVTPETLASFGHITINCASLIASARASALLSGYGAQINTANVFNLPDDARLSTINGSLTLRPGTEPPEAGAFLLINGKLDLVPGCEALLKSYAAILVNGSVTAPESMSGLLTTCGINGSTVFYPDGCIRLGRCVTLERTFALRAKPGALYHVSRYIVALSEDIDFDKLAEKDVRFTAKTLFVTESLVEKAMPLFDENAEIVILPDGCAFVDDDLTLDETVPALYGSRIYVNGDAELLRDGAWLDGLSYLRVGGCLQIARGLEKRVRALGAVCGDREIVGGTQLSGRDTVLLTRAMLERAENGLEISRCDLVTVADDVDAALLRRQLVRIRDCDCVVCTDEQREAIEPVAENVGAFRPDAESDAQADETDEDDADTVRINTATYVF